MAESYKSLSNDELKKRGSFYSILSNASWLAGTRLAGDLASLLFFIVLSRHFGPGGIGLYVYGFAIAGLAYASVNLGLEDYAIRESSRLSLEAGRILIGRLIGSQIGIAVIMLFGLLGFLFLSGATVETAKIILCLLTYQLSLAFARTLFVPAFSQQSMAGPAVTELACRVGAIFIAILLVVCFHSSLPKALIPFIIGGLVLFVLAAISAKRYNGMIIISISLHDATCIIKSAWPFAASVILFYLYARVDLIMLSFLRGDEATGIYATSLKFLEVGVMPFILLGLAAYPVLSKCYNQDDNSFSEAADKLLRTSLILGGLLAWAMIFLGPLVLVPLLGEEFAAAVSVTKIMAVLGLIMAIDMTMVRLLLATHLQVKRVRFQFYGTILNILLNSFLIPLSGVLGAAVALILSQVAMNVLYFRALQRKTPITKTLAKTLRSFLAPLSAALLVGVLLAWLSSNEWLSAAATLVTFFSVVIGMGFMPVRKIKKRSYLVDSQIFRL